jgi:protein SCO1
MKLRRSQIFLLLFLSIPLLFVLFLKFGDYKVKPLPVFGDMQMDSTVIPWVIRDFKLINQDGNTINMDSLEGKVIVASFFYASCPKICPKMNSNLRLAVDKYKSNPRVVFLSHSVDPENDSIEVLKEYAHNFGNYKTSKWQFLTGDKSEIYDLAENYYHVVEPRPEGVEYIHASQVVVIDPDKHVRGFFESAENPMFANELKDAIKAVIKEFHERENW